MKKLDTYNDFIKEYNKSELAKKAPGLKKIEALFITFRFWELHKLPEPWEKEAPDAVTKALANYSDADIDNFLQAFKMTFETLGSEGNEIKL